MYDDLPPGTSGLLGLIKNAIKAVPAVRYALAVAAIGAAVAVIAGFTIDLRVAVFGIIILFVFMAVMVVFARLALVAAGSLHVLAMVLAWAAVILVISTSILLLTSVFFNWPRPLSRWIEGTAAVTPTPTPHIQQNATPLTDAAVPAEKPLVKPPALPGDTGWIFAGYFDTGKEFFTEGPYVSIVRSARRGMRRYVEVGDTIQLSVPRKVFIVDFKKTGTSQKLVSPINKGVIDEFDETGLILPAETQLIVRDVSEGKSPGKVNAALWLRVVHVPSLVP